MTTIETTVINYELEIMSNMYFNTYIKDTITKPEDCCCSKNRVAY